MPKSRRSAAAAQSPRKRRTNISDEAMARAKRGADRLQQLMGEGGDAQQPEKRSDRETVVTLRLPRELHQQIKQEAGSRGFAAEVRRRLEQSIAMPIPTAPEQQFRDVLRVLGHAAIAAAKAQRSDFSAYLGFEVAVPMLIAALRPENEPAPTPEDWWQGPGIATAALMAADKMGLVGRLMGIVREAQEAAQGDKP